jgi:hypothetical protein
VSLNNGDNGSTYWPKAARQIYEKRINVTHSKTVPLLIFGYQSLRTKWFSSARQATAFIESVTVPQLRDAGKRQPDDPFSLALPTMLVSFDAWIARAMSHVLPSPTALILTDRSSGIEAEIHFCYTRMSSFRALMRLSVHGGRSHNGKRRMGVFGLGW